MFDAAIRLSPSRAAGHTVQTGLLGAAERDGVAASTLLRTAPGAIGQSLARSAPAFLFLLMRRLVFAFVRDSSLRHPKTTDGRRHLFINPPHEIHGLKSKSWCSDREKTDI